MDNLKSIRDLSKELSCSYEAIRQHLKRYSNELEGHITKNGRTQYLDEFACEFIKKKRIEVPSNVVQIEKDEYTKHIEKEYQNSLIMINNLQNQLLMLKDQNHALELENLELKLLKQHTEEAPKTKKHWWSKSK